MAPIVNFISEAEDWLKFHFGGSILFREGVIQSLAREFQRVHDRAKDQDVSEVAQYAAAIAELREVLGDELSDPQTLVAIVRRELEGIVTGG